ncbi:MAG: DNA translocase FtsK 4TM domain-containing protein [Patescibacteria group bacterium]|jgi:S-DNA-T family DNA segregation ATPase FtsK/SpoIIIE|nr:DNA translocase FtsK 4TM domain-containing protein [Patescibacteria group bacterium]
MGRKKQKINRIKSLRDLDFSPPRIEVGAETKRWIMVILLIVVGAVSILSLFDAAGTLGVYLNTFLKMVFGVSRWYLPLVLIMAGYFLWRINKYDFKFSNVLGLIIFVLGFNGLIHVFFHQTDLWTSAKLGLGGGYVGAVVAWVGLKIMGVWASIIVCLALSAIGFILLFESYLEKILASRLAALAEDEDINTEEEANLFQRIKQLLIQRRIRKAEVERDRVFNEEPQNEIEQDEMRFEHHEVDIEQVGGRHQPDSGEAMIKTEIEENQDDRKLSEGVRKFKQSKIDLPLDLLDGKTTTPKGGDLTANKLIIQKTLRNFGINAEMGEAQVGPTVTQYTLKPAEGVKLSRITALSDNLALALAAHPIRIEAPIPGRSLVGVEVPNQATAIVPLKEVLASPEFKDRKSNLSLALGKDVMGRAWLAPLEKMPHLLIAGATGSGKSVCINSVILSLLYQNGPGDLKFIMVDPKRVELPIYNSIPHLLTPVITDTKKTVNALRWTIKEMEKRFDMLSESHHRNIESYNANFPNSRIPYIVFIIDELADLMAAAGPEIEGAIVRLAQMSRAVGIHLVLATQRPSVDVLTGLIKANVPARVAFSVASLVDSRTILDMAGAEKLLGRGDMLYLSADIAKPKRLQGTFASDDEIKRIVSYLKEKEEPEYIEEVVEKPQAGFGDGSGGSVDDADSDPLLNEAKEVIFRAKKASASLLQRRLRVGYARAARILDLLEQQGVIGPGDGAKPREILVGLTGHNDSDDKGIDDDLDQEDPGADEDFEEAEEDKRYY